MKVTGYSSFFHNEIGGYGAYQLFIDIMLLPIYKEKTYFVVQKCLHNKIFNSS